MFIFVTCNYSRHGVGWGVTSL